MIFVESFIDLNQTVSNIFKGAGQVEKEDGITYIANFNATTDISSKDSKKVKALFCAEVGGANCMTPLIIAAELGLPVLDCDLMGRAFPEIQMCTHFIKGNAAYPSALGDFYGSKYVCLHAESPKIMEDHFRKVCVDMGCRASTAGAPMSAADIQAKTVLNSISRAFRLGKAVLHARRCKTSPITAILQFEQGIVICTGKVCDIKRKTEGGFAKGEMKIHGSGGFISQHYLINFQNENLIAKRLNENDHHEVIACVPDLISVVDLETGEPIPTDEVSYGLRVAVLALPAPPLLRTPRALEVVGPQAFGYTDVFYKPVGEYLEHMGITPDP